MSKGSGRRRISPSDGIRYDEESEMTNIEERGATSFQSAKKELRLGLRTGAPPTTDSWYGNRGKRWGGRGRKDDNRNWKNHSKGKQYEAGIVKREAVEGHLDVPPSVEASLIRASHRAQSVKDQRNAQIARHNERVRQNGGWWPYWDVSSYPSYQRIKDKTKAVIKTGFAKFEERVRSIQLMQQFGY